MRIRVASTKEICGHNKNFRPIASWYEEKELRECGSEIFYRTYYVSEARIVLLNQDKREVWIDDGSSDGVTFVVHPESASLIFRMIEGKGEYE